MKVINEEIDMIAIFDKEGNVKPYRFKYASQNAEYKINVHKLIKIDRRKVAGQELFVFTCQSNINNCLKLYEILFNYKKMKWFLYKI